MPSVVLSRVGRAHKQRLVDIGKGGSRDVWQVLANGGIATVCAVVTALVEAHPVPPYRAFAVWSAAFAGAYAAATADTWGTEIGTLMRGAPRSILTGRPIAAGLSGGITAWGSAAEVAGAVWIGLCGSILFVPHTVFLPVAFAGLAGALVDSLLGATLQELRWCPSCARTCETNPHVCGSATTLVRGFRGISNDAVNFAATFTGAATAFFLALRI